MKTSQKGLQLIEHCESLQHVGYLCPAGIPTIGYGHTGLTFGKPIILQKTIITEQQAEQLLHSDLTNAENTINSTLRNIPINQNQFDALVCLVFNIGPEGFKDSTVLKKLKLKDYKGACDAFALWNKAEVENPKTHKKELQVLDGLVKRRKSEQYLFTTGEVKFFN